MSLAPSSYFFWPNATLDAETIAALETPPPVDLRVNRIKATVAEAQKALPRPLAVLNDALQGRDYLLGSTFTVADLNLASVLSWSKPIKFDFGPYPNAGAWLDRCLARPAYKAARATK